MVALYSFFFRQHAPPDTMKLGSILQSNVKRKSSTLAQKVAKSQPSVGTAHAKAAASRSSPDLQTRQDRSIVASPPAGQSSPKWDPKKSSSLWKRGGLGIYTSARAAGQHLGDGRTAPAPLTKRPKWDNKKHDPAIHLPIEPKRRSFAETTSPWPARTTKDFPLRTPATQRVLLSRSESLPELINKLASNPTKMNKELLSTLNFGKINQSRGEQTTSMFPASLPGLRPKESHHSQSFMHNEGYFDNLPGRHKDGGKMRHHITGHYTPWDNHWNPLPGIKDWYSGGTATLRCPAFEPSLYPPEEYDDCTF